MAGGIVAVAVAIAVVMSVIICKKKKPGELRQHFFQNKGFIECEATTPTYVH